MTLSYVYVFAVSTEGGLSAPCKVGVSKAPKRRLKEYQTWAPYPIELMGAFQVPSQSIALHIEKAFHSVYSEHRTNGEWFALEPRDCAQGVAIALFSCLRDELGWNEIQAKEAVIMAAETGTQVIV